jgi:hypothetical protein
MGGEICDFSTQRKLQPGIKTNPEMIQVIQNRYTLSKLEE